MIERLMEEYVYARDEDSDPNICVRLVNGDYKRWEGCLIGPPGCPYEGGVYKFTINFPDNYPTGTPDIRFKRAYYHMNIYPDGKPCINLFSTHYRSHMKVAYLLDQLMNIFKFPNPDSPVPSRREIRDLEKTNKAQYLANIREDIRNNAS